MAVVDTHDAHIHTYCKALKLMFFPPCASSSFLHIDGEYSTDKCNTFLTIHL